MCLIISEHSVRLHVLLLSGHGNAIYTKVPIQHHTFYNSTIEFSLCIVTHYIIVAIYIPPNIGITAKVAMITALMDDYVLTLQQEYSLDDILIVGDFNTPNVNHRIHLENEF